MNAHFDIVTYISALPRNVDVSKTKTLDSESEARFAELLPNACFAANGTRAKPV